MYPELRPLFKSLEVDFQPLKMSAAILPCLEFIENNEMLAIYLPQIQDVAITKILQQVRGVGMGGQHLEARVHSCAGLHGSPWSPAQLWTLAQGVVQLIIYLINIMLTILLSCHFQVSQVYQSIEYTHFCSLMPFADRFRIETIIVKAVKTLGVQVS